ncbi:Putative protein kinase [Colletotrichum destructivum]|uniref:non-specific serine/threonine protein kinase n=1 Tax=Colletotrichum destructivum TaxID=34406 RepID=A0AAX4IV34_9PEZI|nr:Putative protein kinase [Colletotrichum destructivum]
MPEYNPAHFYPVRLGEVFNDRFQAAAKLGYGSSSTIWLTRDLQDHQYVALKIYIYNSAQHRELPFYQHLDKFLPSLHPGAKNVRKLLSSFEVPGPHDKHVVLALQVSQMSIRDMDTVFMDGAGFPEGFVKGAVKELLEALDFLHTVVQSVHTDVHPGDLLLGANDDAFFQKLEENEQSSPVPRKQLEDRTIYLSRLMKPKARPLLLMPEAWVESEPSRSQKRCEKDTESSSNTECLVVWQLEDTILLSSRGPNKTLAPDD